MKKLNDTAIWNIIEAMDWDRRSRTEFRAYESIKVEFMLTYKEPVADMLRDFISERYRELARAYNEYTDTHGHGTVGFCGGDDNFSDIMHHVIGSGREVFEGVLEDMTMLRYVHYVESFDYAIPYTMEGMNDYESLDIAKHIDFARKVLTDLTATLVDPDTKLNKGDAEVIGEVYTRMTYMLAGDLAKATENFEFKRDYSRLCAINTGAANAIYDATKLAKYI